MTLSGTSALKYALSKAQVWSYPRHLLYEHILQKTNISEKELSPVDIERIQELAERTSKAASNNNNNSSLMIAAHDISLVARELANTDQNYDPMRLPALKEGIINYLEDELGVKAPIHLELSIVEHYPHPYEHSKAAAWTLGEFESKLLGMPEGVYLRRDQVFPVSSECILGHEYAHSVIVDMPNYVPWFDEGLADILGFAYYSTKHGKVEDLGIWVNYRNELKEYGRWYAEYDRLVSAIILACGMDFVKKLVMLKRENPLKVDWTRLANIIRTNPEYESMARCIQIEMPERSSPPRLYQTISTLFGTTPMVYTISAEAFSVILNLMKNGREAERTIAFSGVNEDLHSNVEDELISHNLIYRHDNRVGIFGGHVIGSEELFSSNLVRAQISKQALQDR